MFDRNLNTPLFLVVSYGINIFLVIWHSQGQLYFADDEAASLIQFSWINSLYLICLEIREQVGSKSPADSVIHVELDRKLRVLCLTVPTSTNQKDKLILHWNGKMCWSWGCLSKSFKKVVDCLYDKKIFQAISIS